MSHLIKTIENKPIIETIKKLERAHSLTVSSIINTNLITINSPIWGIDIKRLEVTLPKDELIGKPKEKFIEIINILATTERTISALKWFLKEYPESIVQECHSSTSDGENDIVLKDKNDKVIVRCEVTDIASSKASQNGKEKKDLRSLGCEKKFQMIL